MTLNSNKRSAFTIIELLMVIAVIGILASIVLVSYNSTQNRSLSSSAQNLAEQVARKLDAYKSVEGSYPTHCQFTVGRTDSTGTPCSVGTAANAGPQEAKLEVPGSVGTAAPTATGVRAGTDYVQYVPCATAGYGGTINWYDYNNARVTSVTTDPSSISVGKC